MGVCSQAGEDGVADLPLERAQGLLAGLALGELLVEVGIGSTYRDRRRLVSLCAFHAIRRAAA